MRITFLGTSAGVPSLQRSLPSIALNYEGRVIMLDCGEGTQRQMMRTRIGFPKSMGLFVTHVHGDHVLGIPGLLQTMSLLGRKDKLEVYGPRGIHDFIESARTYLRFNLRFPVEVYEVGEGTIYKNERYSIVARWAEHSAPNLAYAFLEKDKPGKFYPDKALKLGIPKGPLWHKLQHGKKVRLEDGRVVKPSDVMGTPKPGVRVVYSGDTAPCRSILELARDADLLIHECTFDDSLADNAKEEQHSTPTQAATIAKNAGVKSLILTHISTRYKETSLLLEQARRIFRNTRVAEDFMQMEL